jgi:hypothetical protein
MKLPGATFIDMYLSGQVSPTRIDEWVNAWLEYEYNQYIAPTRTLRSYLGFTEEEYRLWVQDPVNNLLVILSGRKRVSFEDEEPTTSLWVDFGTEIE